MRARKNWMANGLMVVVAIGGFSGISWAEERDSDEDAATGGPEEIVVTAARYEQNIESIPAHVTVIGRTAIDHSTARNIPDLLRSQVGLHVSDIAGNRRSYVVDIRGFGETAALNTLVLVDGRRINAADLSGTDWSLIPLGRVNRIEIIRGGGSSVLYGDNASGGVINIITTKGEAVRAGAEVTLGSYGSYGSSAYLSGSREDLTYSFSGNLQTSGGYRDNSGTDSSGLGMNLRYYPNEAQQLFLSAGYTQNEARLPGALKSSDFAAGLARTDTKQPDDFSDVEDYYIKGGTEISVLGRSQIKLEASFRKREFKSYATFYGGSFTGGTEIETVTVSPMLVLKEPIAGMRSSLTLGFDYVGNQEDIVNESVFSGISSQGEFILEKQNYGYFIHEEINPSETISLSVGYRYDRAEFSFSSGDPNERTLDENLFNVGINYRPISSLDVYVSHASSFRYPVLDELFNFFTNTIDTNLRPQTSRDYEAGIRYRFDDRSGANLNYFRVDTRSEIYFNPSGGLFGFGANENLDDGETRRSGMEVKLYAGFEKVNISVGYTYTDTEIRGGKFSGKAVPNVPLHNVKLEGQIALGHGFAFAANGVYVGNRPFISDLENVLQDQNDYFALNAKLSYVRGPLSLFLDLNNITDASYSEYGSMATFPTTEAAFYPSPSFNFLLGLALDY